MSSTPATPPEGLERARSLVVRRYYAFQLFFSLLFFVPVFYEFQRRIGLSDEAIFNIQSLYYVAFLLLEIPTGFFADRLGHLVSMRAGAITLVASNAVPAIFPTQGGMIAHFVLIALARSFISGASSAYAYERMRELGDTDAFKAVEGRARAISLVARVLCWSVVGFLMQQSLTSPYWLSAIAALVSVVYAYLLPEHVGAPAPPRERERLELLPALRILPSHPMLVLVMLQGVALFVLTRIVQINLFQPILEERHFSVEAYGVVLAVTSIFEAVGSAYPDRLRRFFTDLTAVFLLTLLMAASMSAVALTGKVGAVVALSVFSLVTGLSFPVQRQLLNDVIPDARYRATLMSIESIIDRAGSAVVAAFLGGFVARGQVGLLLHVAAAASAVSMALVYVAMKAIGFGKGAAPRQ